MTASTSHEDLEADATAVIAACDGDPRAAVRVLLVINSYLETELERIKRAVSPGFVRGQLREDPRPGLRIVKENDQS